MKRFLGFAMGLLLAQSGYASAQGLTFSGSVSGELRYFMRPPGFVGQTNQRLYPSLTVTPRLAYDWNGGNDRLVLEPFLRLDSSGNGRGHGDLREAFWLHSGQNWSLTTGISKVFWGVTESRKLVDIINQDDALEDIGGGAKLGQPMVNLSLFGNFGTLDLFVLPLFRERQFLASGARLAGPFAINPAVYTSSSGARNVDFAARWSQSLGSWDFALSRFRGTARAPRMVVAGP
ncbi:MAG: hypothetical protein GXP03_04070, partial [Alphaproteobacteria bacterium]|nr:hypothetical protein [Alphaproteobacteria bacterium]